MQDPLSKVARTLLPSSTCAEPLRKPRVSLTRHVLLRLPLPLLFLLASCTVPCVSAVRIPFDNCLSNGYIWSSVPDGQAQLQFRPLVADAVFQPRGTNHNLLFTVWGNVTGRVGSATLPPPGDPSWNDDQSALNGKIQNSIERPAKNATTLHSTVDVLTYRPYSNDAYFCQSILNGSCPLGPVFNTTELRLPEEPYSLPSFNLSKDFDSNYAFASFSPTMIILYGDQHATTIGCVSATITPSLGGVGWFLKFLPLIVLVVVGLATAFAAIFSPWGSSDVFHWTSNYGRDPDLLRLVTPGFGDCLDYIQFVVLTGSLSLDYPGFFQPATSQASWSVLMFSQQFVSKAKPWQSVVDGVYFTNGTYGLERVAQLDGMGGVEDIWAGMMVWLLVIIAAVLFLVQAGFLARWLWRSVISGDPEEDLRSKKIPFLLGNIVRIAFSYFLLPIVALSTFQLVVAERSPGYLVALAVITLALVLGFVAWLMRLIITTKPRSHLFDDLPTVLLFGPLYNTYSDEAAAFALIPIILTCIRGIAIGAVQPSGTAQAVILAVCEVIHVLTLQAFRPFHSSTSMNIYHAALATLRFVSVILMVAFNPSLGLTEGPKSWIGYTILLLHGVALLFLFFLNALQTIVEVIARLCGAGGDDIRGQTRGGLSKIFGARQLSRRVDRGGGASRLSQLSSTVLLDTAEAASKSGYGRVRSESAASMGIIMSPRRNSSAMDSRSVDAYSIPMGSSTFAPPTPGEASTFSFLPSPGQATRPQPTADPYYRPPRLRRGTVDEAGMSSLHRKRDSLASIDLSNPRLSQVVGDASGDMPIGGRATTPAPVPYAPIFTPRTDYSTREVDYYYGVRGPALNSDNPGRRLGTGPADPTSPVATATGWIMRLFGGKTKEKGKGFEVVRSSRMPSAMQARGGDFSDEGPSEGIPVALGVLRKGPIESDDEDVTPRIKKPRHTRNDSAGGDLLNPAGDADSDEESDEQADKDMSSPSKTPEEPNLLPDLDTSDSAVAPNRTPSQVREHSSHGADVSALPVDLELEPPPEVPRKSSKRNSATENTLRSRPPEEASGSRPLSGLSAGEAPVYLTASARLPFDQSSSQERLSGDISHRTSGESSTRGADERPASYGYVHQRNISRNEPDQSVDLLGSTAEVVGASRKPSPSPSSSG
ncbi:integral membrane protein [Xylariaceae sp. FL0594]|nr:integral membrane protein [Xylariaceae sp. FL0594]